MTNTNYRDLSIKELREKLQRTAPEGERETYTGKTIRFFSIFFTKALAVTKLTPNQITVVSVLIYMLGISMYVFGRYDLNVFGAFSYRRIQIKNLDYHLRVFIVFDTVR